MTKTPNIVYILADDMGYGDLTCLNPQSKIHTENLDQMAEEGIRFTDAHSTSAVCTPSRYSILTGRYNWRSELKQNVLYGYKSKADFFTAWQSPKKPNMNEILRKYDSSLLEQGRMTAASYLKNHGYHTACIGKWHLGWNWARKNNDNTEIDFLKPISDGPITRGGFDYFFGIAGSLDMSPYVYVENNMPMGIPDHLTEGHGKGIWDIGPTAPGFVHENVMPELTARACKYISEQSQKVEPFFLYFPLTAPHSPILPTKEFLGKSGTNEYGDFCLMVDDCVGQIMQTLKNSGVDEDTILIFTSDNGCAPRADFEELAKFGHNPSYIFRGHKADIYEGGHRIPLLVRWPDKIKPNMESQETVCLVDFLATIADYFGEKLPDNTAEDSVSNLKIWLDEPCETPLREAAVHHSFDGSFSIRQGKWKLEFCAGSGGWSYPNPQQVTPDMPKIQLYNLDDDISERKNLYDQYPEIVEKLTKLMTKYVREGRSTPGQPQDNSGPKYWPQLNWLNENDLF